MPDVSRGSGFAPSGGGASVRSRLWYQANRPRLLAKRKAYVAAHLEETRAKVRECGARRRARNKAAVFLHYGQYCACCGETQVEFLSVDHVNGGGGKHKKSIGAYIYDWLVKHNFPEGFQILCFNCNMAKGIYGVCPHAGR